MPLTIKAENNFKQKKNTKSYKTFKELLEKLVLLKIATQTFEAGDFLSIFLRFWGF